MPRDRSSRPGTVRPRPRVTDRVEDIVAWLLMSAWLVLLVGAWMSGYSMHARMREQAEVARASQSQISAVLVEAVPTRTGGPASVGLPVAAAVRWTSMDGSPHTGRVHVMSAAAAGSVVSVWVNRDGTITGSPSSASDAWVAGVLVGFNVLLLGSAVLVGTWIGVRRTTASVNADQWEREWAEVGPTWSRRGRDPI